MTAETTQITKKLVVFQLNEKEYAIPVKEIRSIERLQPITSVPYTPPFVKGVINLRGVIIPIIDLQKYLTIGEFEEKKSSRIIIVTFEEFEVGILVDEANDVLDVLEDSIEEQSSVAGSIETAFISGVVKVDQRLLTILKMDDIVTPL